MNNSQRPERRSPRMNGYDYSQDGAYFVTICTQNRFHLFGEIADEEMRLNAAGELVKQAWIELPKHYRHIELDGFVVMPNHVHGIVFLAEDGIVGEGLRPSPTPDALRPKYGLTEIVRAFKSFSARRINLLRDTVGSPVWQRSFHDHIIRNDKELNILREYILNNPAQWDADTYYAT